MLKKEKETDPSFGLFYSESGLLGFYSKVKCRQLSLRLEPTLGCGHFLWLFTERLTLSTLGAAYLLMSASFS